MSMSYLRRLKIQQVASPRRSLRESERAAHQYLSDSVVRQKPMVPPTVPWVVRFLPRISSGLFFWLCIACGFGLVMYVRWIVSLLAKLAAD
jgi:hypothetical protein